MANQDTTIYEKLLNDVKIYVELQLDYAKLTTADKAATGFAYFILASMLVVLLAFLFIYGNVFLAILLGWYFESYLIGFAAFTAGYLFLILVLLASWKRLSRWIRNRFLHSIVNEISSNQSSH